MNVVRSITLASFLAAGVVWVLGCNSSSVPPGGAADHHGDQQHTHDEHAGHEGAAAQLIVSADPSPSQIGKATKLRLMVHEASGKMVKEFEVTHEKLAHLIVVRRGLDEFAHLHPAVDSQGNLDVEYVFPAGGEYLLFLDYQPKGGSPATATTTLQVAGDSPAAPTLVANVPGQVKSDGLRAAVSLQKTTNGTAAVFEIEDEQGQAVPDLQPYLGAMGHLVVISADGKQYVHAHPLTEKPGTAEVKFEVHFPGPGLYKMWGQFQRDDKVITFPAVVRVDAAAHSE